MAATHAPFFCDWHLPLTQRTVIRQGLAMCKFPDATVLHVFKRQPTLMRLFSRSVSAFLVAADLHAKADGCTPRVHTELRPPMAQPRRSRRYWTHRRRAEFVAGMSPAVSSASLSFPLLFHFNFAFPASRRGAQRFLPKRFVCRRPIVDASTDAAISHPAHCLAPLGARVLAFYYLLFPRQTYVFVR
jgi:hypothetical protein